MMNRNSLQMLVVSLCAIILLVGCALSKKDIVVEEPTPKTNYCELTKFSAQYNIGKVYVNWLVNTNISNYYFVLEKSTDDGNTFNILQIRKGSPCPSAIKEGLLYSYVDDKLTATSRIYRLRAIQPIKNGQGILLYTDGKNLFKNNDKSLVAVKNDTRTASK